MNFNLREFLKRIAWRRVALLIALILLIQFCLTHRLHLRMMLKKLTLFFDCLSRPLYNIGNHSHSEAFDLCLICVALITFIGIVRLLRQGQ